MRRDASASLSDGSNSSLASSLKVFRYEAWAPVIGSSPVVQSEGSFSVLDGVPASGVLGSADLAWSCLASAMVRCSCQYMLAYQQASVVLVSLLSGIFLDSATTPRQIRAHVRKL